VLIAVELRRRSCPQTSRLPRERPLDDEAQKTAQRLVPERAARETRSSAARTSSGIGCIPILTEAALRRVGAETFKIHRSPGKITRVCPTANRGAVTNRYLYGN
jgi:hypothetical protein